MESCEFIHIRVCPGQTRVKEPPDFFVGRVRKRVIANRKKLVAVEGPEEIIEQSVHVVFRKVVVLDDVQDVLVVHQGKQDILQKVRQNQNHERVRNVSGYFP